MNADDQGRPELPLLALRPQAGQGADAAIIVDAAGLQELAWGFSRAAMERGSARIAFDPGDGHPYDLLLLIAPGSALSALPPRYVGDDADSAGLDTLETEGIGSASTPGGEDIVQGLVDRELLLQRLQFREELDDTRSTDYWIARLAKYIGAANDADDGQFMRRMTQVAAVAISAAKARLRVSPAGREVLGDGSNAAEMPEVVS